MANFEKTTLGCFGITAVYIVPALALLLVGMTLFGMPVNVLIGCLVWIVVCLAVSTIYPNSAGLVLSEFVTTVFFAAWSQSIVNTSLFKDAKKSSDVFFAYALPFIAAVALWHIGSWIRDRLNENKKIKEKFDRMEKAREAEKADAQDNPVQAVEVIEAEPAPEPVQDTVQNPDADEERHLAEEARRKAEEAQKEAEEARQRVEEAQKRAARAAQKMEDAMKRAKLAQEQLKKAQAEAEKLKNQNKKT